MSACARFTALESLCKMVCNMDLSSSWRCSLHAASSASSWAKRERKSTISILRVLAISPSSGATSGVSGAGSSSK